MTDQLAVFIDFENIALWAEREFFDFEVTKLIEYLQTRGPAVVKRAYGDWSRFYRYRDELMNNSIDLIQIYSVRVGKNRADIRMAIDAFEIAMTRPQINTFVIVSGDSDFGPLVAKLREYGRYTLGIGPRSVTHHLLVKSCDEFIYLETALGEMTEVVEQSGAERESARSLLIRAIQAHGQRGELPVLATRLKQTMLLMDPAFNEANFGYSQFKGWLEDNRDLVNLYMKDLQLYVAPLDYVMTPGDGDLILLEPAEAGKEEQESTRHTIDVQYKNLFARLKMTTFDLTTRRDILRDIYRELCENPNQYNAQDLLDMLQERYDAQGLPRTMAGLRETFQLALHQNAFDTSVRPLTSESPLCLAPGIESEADFVRRAESSFVYAVVRTGLEVDLQELAYLILNDQNQTDYIQSLLDDLKQRGLIQRKGKNYVLTGQGEIPFHNEPALQVLVRDIENAVIPENTPINPDMARMLAKKAMVQRSQDFAASANTYLIACRLQWESVQKGEPGATIEDLRWYMASYASAIAGKLSQVNRDYNGARPYYLAFFALVQEDDPLWSRMRGLINPMLSYYWANAGRELELNTSAWNLSMSSPAQIAIHAATHPNPDLRRLWTKITEELARVNPKLLLRIANQIMLTRSEYPEQARVAEQIEEIVAQMAPV